MIETLNAAEEIEEKRIEKQARQAYVFCILVQSIFLKSQVQFLSHTYQDDGMILVMKETLTF